MKRYNFDDGQHSNLYGIYLASFKALHEGHNIVYQDINGKRDLGGDMMDIDLEPYDFIIATPPCNYWSRANWRRNTSKYSLKTKHLLPSILNKLCNQDKPFIVENVLNKKMFIKEGFYHQPCFIYCIGGHTYWTNVMLPIDTIMQYDQNKQYISRSARQGGINVHNVIECFLDIIGA